MIPLFFSALFIPFSFMLFLGWHICQQEIALLSPDSDGLLVLLTLSSPSFASFLPLMPSYSLPHTTSLLSLLILSFPPSDHFSLFSLTPPWLCHSHQFSLDIISSIRDRWICVLPSGRTPPQSPFPPRRVPRWQRSLFPGWASGGRPWWQLLLGSCWSWFWWSSSLC